jgi:hypothetical protein
MHYLSQNYISASFTVKVSASDDLENPESKTTPDNEEVTKLYQLMEF